MRKILVLLPVIFVLASCGDTSKIKDVIRQNLKDPGSAEFKDTAFSADNKRACIVWNAKNSMGGYGNWAVAEFVKKDSVWIVKAMKGSESNCTDTGFKAIDASEKAELDAKLMAIETLKKVRNISSEQAASLATYGECQDLVWNFAYYSSRVAEYRIRQSNQQLALVEERLKDQQTRLDNGDCKRQ